MPRIEPFREAIGTNEPEFIVDGDLVVKDLQGKEHIRLDSLGSINIKNSQGATIFRLRIPEADLYLGGNGQDGDILVFPSSAQDQFQPSLASFRVGGDSGVVLVGGGGTNGRLVCIDESGDQRVFLDGTSGSIEVKNQANRTTIRIDGEAGDIILHNGDCAEEFGIAEGAKVSPGSVLVIGPNETLRLSDRAYDKRVAGVVAGAGGVKPGIILGKKATSTRSAPVALAGRVFCKVDASVAPIEVGDLLTTSDRPGFAMRASDAQKAFGSVLGKALAPLESGTGMIPILVTLQ